MSAGALGNERRAGVTVGAGLRSYGGGAAPKLRSSPLQARPPQSQKMHGSSILEVAMIIIIIIWFLITVVLNNGGERKTHPVLSSRHMPVGRGTNKCKFASSLRSSISYNSTKFAPLRDLIPSSLYLGKYTFV